MTNPADAFIKKQVFKGDMELYEKFMFHPLVDDRLDSIYSVRSKEVILIEEGDERYRQEMVKHVDSTSFSIVSKVIRRDLSAILEVFDYEYRAHRGTCSLRSQAFPDLFSIEGTLELIPLKEGEFLKESRAELFCRRSILKRALRWQLRKEVAHQMKDEVREIQEFIDLDLPKLIEKSGTGTG